MKKLSSHHCAWWEGGDSNSGPDYRPQGLLPLWSEGSHSDALLYSKPKNQHLPLLSDGEAAIPIKTSLL